jgi:hypothetical protein
MNNKEYNGHYNYETWLINLHCADDIQDLANVARNQYELSKDIKNFVEENMIKDDKGENITNCFLTDLIGSALSEVNWQELAESYIQKNGAVFNQEVLQGDSNDDR